MIFQFWAIKTATKRRGIIHTINIGFHLCNKGCKAQPTQLLKIVLVFAKQSFFQPRLPLKSSTIRRAFHKKTSENFKYIIVYEIALKKLRF